MIGVVPLAGPDFERADGTVKATDPFRGGSLLREVLEGRSWRRSGALADRDMVFVLRDSPPSRRFSESPLSSWYPRAQTVFLSATTGGAALSALAGLALLAHRDEPVVVDLADIWFSDEADIAGAFAADAALGGLLATFRASDPIYSYARLDRAGDVAETREKQVISDHASAGVYAFRSPAVYAAAVARSLADPAAHVHKGLHFVCPLMNGVIAQGYRVRTFAVAAVEDVKQGGRGNGR
jgi:hypothetical protein